MNDMQIFKNNKLEALGVLVINGQEYAPVRPQKTDPVGDEPGETIALECPQLESLPDILTAAHIAKYMHFSGRRVYELMDLSPDFGGIRSFRIGRSRRVEKADFIAWLKNRKEG